VHGVLHAQGMDHEDEAQAREMEARETGILRRFRIGDPYRDAGTES
jgi:probable rRNA maturation factor